MIKKGLFIVVEGIDGSGKTTQIKNLYEYLTSKGIPTTVTREPGGTVIGEKIRDIVLDKAHKNMDAITEMLLIAASRAQHVVEFISAKQKAGVTVICDRYVLSSYVYQGVARGIELETVKKVNEYAMSGVIPDITFFINIDNEESVKRRSERQVNDRIENEDNSFHIKVCNGYREMVKHLDNVEIIDGMQKVENVTLDIVTHINKLIRRLDI